MPDRYFQILRNWAVVRLDFYSRLSNALVKYNMVRGCRSNRLICYLLFALLINACGGDSTLTPEIQPAMQPATALQLPSQLLLQLRVGETLPATDLFTTHHANATYSINPTLPAGLEFSTDTGRLSGSAIAVQPQTRYTVGQHITADTINQTLDIAIGTALPSAFHSLEAGFTAETIVSNANFPVRMAVAPDGRIFYNELTTGNIRVIDPQTGLLPTPFAQLKVAAGRETGLLGLALDPSFENNNHVYVYATLATPSGDLSHAAVLRFTDRNNRGTEQRTIVDQLPASDLHNGGDLVFDNNGHLFIGRGDVDDPSTAQIDGDLSGKILRYRADGSIPADNPFPSSPEWARGIRNTFAMTLHPRTGDLFGADAGPAENDKLNFLTPAKNFVWGMDEEPDGPDIGFSIHVWHEVITPTGLHFHSGKGNWQAYRDRLFITSYNDENLRQIVLLGDAFTDYLREPVFAGFADDEGNNKPLHVTEGADGSLYVSTTNAIYRIYVIE